MSRSKFEISICGGGIGGLILAITLGKHSTFPIHIYEAQPEIGTLGAGVAMAFRLTEILRDLGLHNDIAAVSSPPPPHAKSLLNRISDSAEAGYDWFHEDLSKNRVYSMHRRDLMEILQKAIPTNCTLHFNKRLAYYTEDENGELTLHFDDGAVTTSRVLIGADGLRSPTRTSMFEGAARRSNDSQLTRFKEPVFSGIVVYRALVQTEKLLERYPNHPILQRPQFLCGYERYIVAYLIEGGKTVNFVGYVVRLDPHCRPDNNSGSLEPEALLGQEVVDAYRGYEPIAWTLAECCESERVKTWSLSSVKPIPFWSQRNVAIIGDAAHGMLPHLGAGAGQAIEDAWLLGRLLADRRTTLANIPAVFGIYEKIRKPLAERMVSCSEQTARMSTFCAPEQIAAGDAVRSPDNLRRWATEILDWRAEAANQPSVLQQWAEAENLLQNLLE